MGTCARAPGGWCDDGACAVSGCKLDESARFSNVAEMLPDAEPITMTAQVGHVASMTMADGETFTGEASSPRDAMQTLLNGLRDHYGRHFKLTCGGEVICSTVAGAVTITKGVPGSGH